MVRALFAATFDPPTNGHIDIARRAAAIFDEVIMGVYETPQKAGLLFGVQERVEMVREAVADLPNVRVDSYRSLTVDYARQIGARVMVRGLRVISDFEWEFQIALTNQKLGPELDTVCLMARIDYSYLSSSIVKDVAKHGGPVDCMVPPHVARALRRAYGFAQEG